MIKVYSIALVLGLIALLVIILGGALAENLGREDRDPGVRIGPVGKLVVGAAIGFGMGGMSAEFSPLDLSWQVSLLIAIGAAIVSGLWVRYSVGQTET
ncbi:MAG TPA: hypothetical protein VMQ46_05505 [Acidimicrobiia bacterium]|nr:hypothetical protein [Acidimicrobiia bacterium]